MTVKINGGLGDHATQAFHNTGFDQAMRTALGGQGHGGPGQGCFGNKMPQPMGHHGAGVQQMGQGQAEVRSYTNFVAQITSQSGTGPVDHTTVHHRCTVLYAQADTTMHALQSAQSVDTNALDGFTDMLGDGLTRLNEGLQKLLPFANVAVSIGIQIANPGSPLNGVLQSVNDMVTRLISVVGQMATTIANNILQNLGQGGQGGHACHGAQGQGGTPTMDPMAGGNTGTVDAAVAQLNQLMLMLQQLTTAVTQIQNNAQNQGQNQGQTGGQNFGGTPQTVAYDMGTLGTIDAATAIQYGVTQQVNVNAVIYQQNPHCEHGPDAPPPPLDPVAVENGRVWGDPHFVGADGGKYDVQGEAGKTYNILSDKGLQVNARFDEFNGVGSGMTVMGGVGVTLEGHSLEAQKNGEILIDGHKVGPGHYLGGKVEVTQDGKVKVNEEEFSFELHHRPNARGDHWNMENIRSDNAAADGVMPKGLWGGSVDGDGEARDGDKGKGTQGGGAIETLDGEIAARGDKTTVQQYEVGGLFDTQFVNNNQFAADGYGGGQYGPELINNGSFEAHGALNRGSWGTFDQIAGWTATEGQIEIQEGAHGGTPANAADNAVLELDSHGHESNSRVEQTVHVQEPGKHVFSFDYSPRQRGDEIGDTSGVNVIVNGVVIDTIAADQLGYETQSYVVDLPAGDNTIAFEAVGTEDTFGALIDNVSLRRAPTQGEGGGGGLNVDIDIDIDISLNLHAGIGMGGVTQPVELPELKKGEWFANHGGYKKNDDGSYDITKGDYAGYTLRPTDEQGKFTVFDAHNCAVGTYSSKNGADKVASPIAFDMNGDGRIGVTGETTAKEGQRAALGKTVEFDIDADGDKDTIEWMAGDGDALLVDNRDGQAASDMDGARLFGDQGGKYANGFEKLSQLDVNGDGALTDAELLGLALWNDDGDAVVEEGELISALSAGVERISVEMGVEQNARGEDLMRSDATIKGERVMSEDVWFGEDR